MLVGEVGDLSLGLEDGVAEGGKFHILTILELLFKFKLTHQLISQIDIVLSGGDLIFEIPSHFF